MFLIRRDPAMQRKLLAAFGSSVLVLVVAFVANESLARTENAQAWVDHTVKVRGLGRQLSETLLEAEVAQLTYLVTLQDEALEPARGAAARAGSLLDTLSALTADNAQSRGRIEAIRAPLAASLEQLSKVLALADAEHRDQAVALVRQSEYRAAFAAVREEIGGLLVAENRLLTERYEASRENTTTTRFLLLGGSIVAFVLSLIVVFLIRRGVVDLEVANQKVAETASQLADKTDQLERSLAELDQFAYVASHDLKAPLRGISNLAQWIGEDNHSLGDEGREHLRLMQNRVARMEALVDGILAYSRAGRKREPVELVDVGQLLRETIDLLAPGAGASVTVDASMPVVKVERVPFQQVWLNLVSNALKHGKPDGKVRLGHKKVDGVDAFFVQDDGPGIDARFHERVFGLFQTLAPRDKVEGTGIGLAVVKKLVEAHRGRVWLESEVGKGATFYFTWRGGARSSGNLPALQQPR